MNPNSGSLRRFLEESPFPDYLERCWNGRYYLNFPVESGKSTYYYVYGPDEYSTYGYQIIVEDDKVTSLRARQTDINW